MNVQSRFRDLDVSTARSKARKSWVARYHVLPILLVAALLALGAGYYLYGQSGQSAGTPVIVTATRGDIDDVVTAVGNLQPLTSVDVGAQVSGQLDTLHVQIGDDVQKGALLAEIDSAVMGAKVDADTAQLQNLQAQLAERQSQLVLAQAQADRQDRLMKDNATSQDALDVAKAAFQSAQAQLKSIQAQIDQAQSSLKADRATLSYSKIYAPMTGTVTAIPAKQGQTLNANQQAPTILTISDLSTMTVSAQVSEADVAKLRIGMDAYFTTLGSNRRYTGKLRQILPTPTVTNNVVLYTALFDVANPNKQLMTQMTAQVFFVRAAAHDAVTIPVAALHFTAAPGRGGARAGAAAGQGAGAATDQGARAGRNGAGANGGGRRGGGGGQFGGGRGGGDPDAGLRPRAATVTLVKDDGMQETRDVMVGVTDRVNAQIISGLAEGEKVVAGTQTAGGNTTRPQQRPAGLPVPGGQPLGGGFR
jgi:macrolide-specific efflux system membrane fusion protein